MKAAPLRTALRGWRLRLELQLGSRFLLFAIIDGVLVVVALLQGLLSGGEPRELYFGTVLLAPLLVGLPALADLVALERNAGSLDLALATPRPVAYFVRRVAAVGGVLYGQAAFTLLALWFSEGFSFPLVPPLVTALVSIALLGATTLFWALRVETSGAVWFASLATLAALGRWFFANPIPERQAAAGNPFFARLPETLSWLGDLAVLVVAASLFTIYARRRLERPERLLT